VRKRAFLTVAATMSAALSAAIGGAATASAAVPSTPTIAGQSDTLDVANNWCVAPLLLNGPASTNDTPDHYRVCGHNRAGGNGGVNILNNLCVAPIDLHGPLAPAGTGHDYVACNDETTDGPPTLGPITVLRNLSVLGVRATF
jgi:hypothetical protein